jgi:hypothetical protein
MLLRRVLSIVGGGGLISAFISCGGGRGSPAPASPRLMLEGAGGEARLLFRGETDEDIL